MHKLNPSFPYYTHLVLSGGGLSGLIYIGVYRFLQQYHLLKNIRYFSGTSIGAIFAYLFGLGVEYEYLESFVMGNEDTEGLCTRSPMLSFDPRNILQLPSKRGIYSTERFRAYLTTYLQKKHGMTDITFAQYIKLTGVDLHINVTCLNSYRSLDLCNDTFPEMSVITAVLASMSVPLLFEPVVYQDMLLVDGGCCVNLPIQYLATNTANKVLAINLGTDIEFTKEQLENFLIYGASIMLSMITSHTKTTIKDHEKRVDILEVNQNPIPFLQAQFEKDAFYMTMTKEQLDEGILYGYQQIHEFFTSKGYFEQTS